MNNRSHEDGPLRVLITVRDLTQRAGTQLYVRDVCLALLSEGHQPVVYSPRLGSVARELQAATIPVIDNLEQLAIPPHVIHGNQHAETMTALLHFPGVPAIYVCHSWRNLCEAPPMFPRIVRYIAVDATCYDRLTSQHGIDETKTRIIFNFVDLARFTPRSALPPKPARALLFSNRKDHWKVVRDACDRSRIALDVIGAPFGIVCEQPELELQKYDLVFAKGRSALEAMAVGAAVVLCDAMGSGPLVTARDLDYLRRLNFGARALRAPLTIEALEREIARYDAEDARKVSEIVRATAGKELAVTQLVETYEDVIREFSASPRPACEEEGRAAARYIRQLEAEHFSQDAQTSRWRNMLLNLPFAGRALGPLKKTVRHKE